MNQVLYLFGLCLSLTSCQDSSDSSPDVPAMEAMITEERVETAESGNLREVHNLILSGISSKNFEFSKKWARFGAKRNDCVSIGYLVELQYIYSVKLEQNEIDRYIEQSRCTSIKGLLKEYRKL